MTYGSLFSGIGGFDLGLDRAGFTPLWQAERDAACLRTLTRHWPTVQRFDDVKAVEVGVPTPDLICGGFPCQDLSVAGKRAGLAGERSGLFFEFVRILGALAPRWVLIENVPGLFSSAGGRDFAVVLSEMVKLGYGVAWRVLDAQHFGVAQRRRRVFIVGCLGDAARAAAVLFESESCDGDPAPGHQERARVAACLRGRSAKPGVNEPGRGGEDDSNLVAGYSESGPGWWRDGTGPLRAEGENRPSRPSNIVSYGISSDAVDRSGEGDGSAAERAGLGIVEEASPAIRARQNNSVAMCLKGTHRGVEQGHNGNFVIAQDAGGSHWREGNPTLAASDDNGTNQVVYQCHSSNVGPMGSLRAGRRHGEGDRCPSGEAAAHRGGTGQ